jgi:hypothetical protein
MHDWDRLLTTRVRVGDLGVEPTWVNLDYVTRVGHTQIETRLNLG